MTEISPIDEGRELLARLASICREISDDEVYSLLVDGGLNDLMTAVFDPTQVSKHASIGEFFLANKNRSALMAGLRAGITKCCAIKADKEGTIGYVSPSQAQWFENAVLVLEGAKPFEGLVCKYEDGEISYAVAARDIAGGENVGPDDFHFVDLEEIGSHFKKPPKPHELEIPIQQLRTLLDSNESDESKYQELLARHPWVLGLQYESIQRHGPLDDKNIPDFTGIRVHDNCRDIIEIKPPTMPVFRADGEFTAPFNAAWNQAERYLNFAREETDYLRRKGLRFDNPKCTLLCGVDLPIDLVKKIRVKERLNPALKVLTFNDLIAFMEATAKFVVEHVGR